jgi:hypothetical protein
MMVLSSMQDTNECRIYVTVDLAGDIISPAPNTKSHGWACWSNLRSSRCPVSRGCNEMTGCSSTYRTGPMPSSGLSLTLLLSCYDLSPHLHIEQVPCPLLVYPLPCCPAVIYHLIYIEKRAHALFWSIPYLADLL